MRPFAELRERLLRAGVAPRYVRRYLTELADHWDDLVAQEEYGGCSRANAEASALIRLGKVDDLAQAMLRQRRFQSWCTRAPWAMFGVAPVFALAGIYLVACLILWSGWNIFLPGTDSPFTRLHGLAILYFGVGRLMYLGAPVFVGWGICALAARQRFNLLWPTMGFVLIALVGVTARIHTTPPIVPNGIGHVSMNFAFQSSSLAHATLNLLLIILPYLIWLSYRARRTVSG